MPSSVCMELANPLILLKKILHIALDVCIVLFSAKPTHEGVRICKEKRFIWGLKTELFSLASFSYIQLFRL